MPEYIYLLETRLSAAQQDALAHIRDAAREAGTTVFLAGGAVRDLTTGSSVRDLDFAVQGNALTLEKSLVARGATLWGRHEPSRTLFLWFPGSVRVEIASTRSERFPKPGKPVYTWNGIIDDLHRRDFTANAMALSLNEGSYGLLLDPLNGVADIEARQLRLVSSYGFLEDPARLVRAVRLMHRLGWTLEERTAIRYENAKEADTFDAISPFLRGYELEKIAAEEEALATLKALEAEGWMRRLLPAWTSASVDTAALEDLHRNRIQLLMQGVAPDLSAAHLEVLTAKMGSKDREALKAMMVRPGLRAQWEGLDAASREFARLLTGKEAATPSATWKLFRSHPAEPILWLAHTRKTQAAEARFKNFFTVWPEAAKKVPVAMMLEMRITPELAIYPELLRELFLQQIDGKLETDEQMRAFLEAYSPPAPPPPVTLRRSRSKKAEGKGKRKGAARDHDGDEDDREIDRPNARGEDDEDEDDEERKPGSDEERDEDEPRELGQAGAGRKLAADKADGTDEAEERDRDEAHESSGKRTVPGRMQPKAKPGASALPVADKAAAPAKTAESGKSAAPEKSATPAKVPAPAKAAVPVKAVPSSAKPAAPVKAAASAKPAAAATPLVPAAVPGKKSLPVKPQPRHAGPAGKPITEKSHGAASKPLAGKSHGAAGKSIAAGARKAPEKPGTLKKSAPAKVIPAPSAAKKALPARKAAAPAPKKLVVRKAAPPARAVKKAVAKGKPAKASKPARPIARLAKKPAAKPAAKPSPAKKTAAKAAKPARKR